MGMDDLFSTESAFVAAVTATVLSPKTRETVRKGAVYGLAGALRVGDVMAGAARGAVRGIRGGGEASSAGETVGATAPAPVPPAPAPVPPAPASTPPRPRRSTNSGAATRRAAATAKQGGDAAES